MFICTMPDGNNCCPAYCDCSFPSPIAVNALQGHNIADLVKCNCGEDTPKMRQFDWLWHYNDDRENNETRICGGDVTFHILFSQGTSIVRGEKPLKAGHIHYWEIRILTALTGTDVMFGIGTDKMDMQQFKYHFVSALGTNSQSWGFSYNGRIQHNGLVIKYGQKFSQGCIVGVKLDRMHGHLEFFLNRRSLGVAYKNIPVDPNIVLYPMISSTAARSTVRLINSTCEPESLQYRAFRTLATQPTSLAEVRQLPGLRPLLSAYWFVTPPVRYSCRSRESEYDIADEAVLSISLRHRHKIKFKDEETEMNDIYANTHEIISAQQQNDSDDDGNATLGEYYDEYFHFMF